MSFLQTHTLSFTPLSPVHIGCNQVYEPTNYVVDQDALYEFDTEQLIQLLPAAEQNKLLNIVSAKPNDQMLKNVQQFFYQQRATLAASAEHFFPVSPGFAQFYQKRIGQTAQRESNGRAVINRLTIERSSYDLISRKPLIPGSSIKGAIRTAVLDALNGGRPTQRFEKSAGLQQRLANYSELHQDPFRLISLSDAKWSANHPFGGSEIRFAINKRRKASSDGKASKAEEQNLYQQLECIVPFQARSFSGQLAIHAVDTLGQRQANRLPDAAFRWSAQQLAAACNAFYKPLFAQETKALRERGLIDTHWQDTLKQLLNADMAERIKKNQAFLLRVGRHSGAESVTLNGVRQIKIMQGKGQKAVYKDKPQTWWLAANDTKDQKDLMPFGWLVVEIDPSATLSNQPQLDQYQAPRHQWYQAKQTQHHQRKQALIEQRQALEKQRQEAAERQRQQQIAAEKQAKEQAKEQAKRDSLSQEQRLLYDLAKKLQADIDNDLRKPNLSTCNQVHDLLKLAQDWPAAERVQLADLAEKIYNHHKAWGNSKKKQEKRGKISALRQP